MAKISANDLRPGMLVEHEGTVWKVVSCEHVKVSGRGGAGIQVELKAAQGQSKLARRFRTEEKLGKPFVDNRRMQYLYSEGDRHVFMDGETFEQCELAAEDVGAAAGYLLPSTEVVVCQIDGRPVSVEPPAQVELAVASTAPQIKGATATASFKPATMETGITVMVPPFVKEGETVRVSTATGEYLERAG